MTPGDIDDKLSAIGHKLQEGDIVCVHTNAPKHVASREYIKYGVGIDAWSWDAPFIITAQKWKKSVKAKSPDTSIIWEGHFAGRDLGYFQLEKLTNLDKVPPIGATMYCFPVKIARASAGWVRAVATIPE